MRKLSILALAAVVAASFATAAFAGPSRAVVQELGIVAPEGQVNADFGFIDLNVPTATVVTTGTATGTIGTTRIQSVNVGLGNGFEVRTGILPGLSGLVTGLPVTNTQSGVTVKYAGFVPGLAVYGAYGSNSTTAGPGAAAAATSTNAMRLGAAYTYTAVAPWLLNGNIEIGNNTPNAGATTSTTDIAVAAFYPLNKNVLIGGEYLNSSFAANATTVTASGFGLGGRVTAGNFTIDALLYTNISTSATGAVQNGNTTQMGNPALVRINYAF